MARSTLESAATDARIGGRGGEKEKKEKEDRSRIRPTIAPILQGGHGHTGPAGQDTLTHHCVVVLVAMPSAFVVYVYAPCARAARRPKRRAVGWLLSVVCETPLSRTRYVMNPPACMQRNRERAGK